MNKLLALATVALLGLTGSAHAALVDVTLGNTSSSLSYGTGGSLSPNINLSTYGGLLLNNAQIVAAGTSLSGQYASPTGSLYGGNYVSVFGVPATGSATFALAANENTFSFTWGTVDPYNTVVLTDSRGTVYTVTGDDIGNQIAGSIAGSLQTDVKFFDPYGSIVTAQLVSTQNSFEAGNFGQGVSSVPLPASLPLFALALGGLFVVARRKANKSI